MKKFKYYNIGTKTQKWIQSYLNDRSFYVEIGDKCSSFTNADTGVPQGSCLGQLLYLIFVNEIPETIKDIENCDNEVHRDRSKLFGENCKTCGCLPVYADDGICIISGKERTLNQEAIEDKFRKIKDFLTANGLAINDGKTALMEFMTKQKRGRLQGSPPQLQVTVLEEGQLKDKMITDTKTCRFLGASLQNNLAWQNHLTVGNKSVLPSIKRQLGALYTLRDMIPQRSRLLIANSIVIGRMVYLIPLWVCAMDNYLRRAQSTLNFAVRFVMKAARRTRTKDLMLRCGWMNIKQMILYYSLIQCWKILKLKTPISMYREFTIEDNWMISTLTPRLQLTASCIRWNIISKWNSVNEDLRTEKKISFF